MSCTVVEIVKISQDAGSVRRRPELSDCLLSEKFDELAEFGKVKV